MQVKLHYERLDVSRIFWIGLGFFKIFEIDIWKNFFEKNIRRGLGFDKPQINPEIKATCGCVSDKSFGHSGFTGTYTWADPVSKIVYVFFIIVVLKTICSIN